MYICTKTHTPTNVPHVLNTGSRTLAFQFQSNSSLAVRVVRDCTCIYVIVCICLVVPVYRRDSLSTSEENLIGSILYILKALYSQAYLMHSMAHSYRNLVSILHIDANWKSFAKSQLISC